jgi:valyl-tRNA synthetase
MVLEPHLTEQWYVDAATLAAPALAAVREGRTRFVPAQWQNTYERWLEDIRPWCISRQLWWGHQIPVWYDPDGRMYVAESLEEAQEQAGQGVRLTQDPDVLDTWFSAALWPFATLGWPDETPELARYYPTDTLVTGFDIIFFWVARMMMMGLHFTGDVPFRDVHVHALVRDAKGQKMSKTRGNVIDPLELCDRYGADAVRFALAALATPGRDIRMAEGRVAGYRNFATKLWNAARFAQMNGVALCDTPRTDTELARWIVGEMDATRAAVEAAVEAYQFHAAADAVYHFVWHTFCDWYLEFAKDAPDTETTGFVLKEILKILNIFMPFLTEELYAALGGRGLLAAQPWPEARARDADAAARVGQIRDIIAGVRSVRKDVNIPDAARPALYVEGGAGPADCARLEGYAATIGRMAGVGQVACCATPPGAAVRVVAGGLTLALPVGDLIDPAVEGARLRKEIAKLDGTLRALSHKLENKGFLDSAPAEVVAETRERLATETARRARLAEALAAIGA